MIITKQKIHWKWKIQNRNIKSVMKSNRRPIRCMVMISVLRTGQVTAVNTAGWDLSPHSLLFTSRNSEITSYSGRQLIICRSRLYWVEIINFNLKIKNHQFFHQIPNMGRNFGQSVLGCWNMSFTKVNLD